MKPIRAFIAVEFDDVLKRRLGKAVERLAAAAGRAVRWVRPEGMHLTLKFLGEIEMAAVVDVRRIMVESAAGMDPWVVTLKGLGTFGGRCPRVVWAGVDDPTGGLVKVAGELNLRLEELGIRAEHRAYTPHLTLGRVRGKGRLDDLVAAVAGSADEEFGPLVVETLVLFESELRPEGAVYTRLDHVDIGE